MSAQPPNTGGVYLPSSGGRMYTLLISNFSLPLLPKEEIFNALSIKFSQMAGEP